MKRHRPRGDSKTEQCGNSFRIRETVLAHEEVDVDSRPRMAVNCESKAAAERVLHVVLMQRGDQVRQLFFKVEHGA